MENIESKIIELSNRLLSLTAEVEYENDINHANYIFKSGLSDNVTENGFNDWLIYDYVFDNKSSFINELIKNTKVEEEELKLLQAMKKSIFSVFMVGKVNNMMFLKDIFTKEDHVLAEEMDISRNLIIARIFKYRGKTYIVNIEEDWKEKSESSIQKSILEKYNKYSEEDRNTSISDFIQNNSLVIYKYLMIYKNTESNLVFNEEEFYVYEGIYKIIDKEKFKTIATTSNKIERVTDELDDIIYELIPDGFTLSELIIKGDRLELECRTQEELDIANEVVAEIFGKSIQKIKDKVLSVEDVLK